MPENLLRTFLIFSVCAGVALSYLILRSSWHGWPLVGAVCLGMYGVSTVATQIDSIFFLSNKLPRGMIRAIFNTREFDGGAGGIRTRPEHWKHVSYSFYVTPQILKTRKSPHLVTRRLRGAA
jgi:hypothetical protein